MLVYMNPLYCFIASDNFSCQTLRKLRVWGEVDEAVVMGRRDARPLLDVGFASRGKARGFTEWNVTIAQGAVNARTFAANALNYISFRTITYRLDFCLSFFRSVCINNARGFPSAVNYSAKNWETRDLYEGVNIQDAARRWRKKNSQINHHVSLKIIKSNRQLSVIYIGK